MFFRKEFTLSEKTVDAQIDSTQSNVNAKTNLSVDIHTLQEDKSITKSEFQIIMEEIEREQLSRGLQNDQYKVSHVEIDPANGSPLFDIPESGIVGFSFFGNGQSNGGSGKKKSDDTAKNLF